jgi:hypothetical protein
MKFLLVISDSYGELVQTFSITAADKEAASKKAIEKFDYYSSDFGGSWSDTNDLPSVILYEVENSIRVDVKDHWSQGQKEQEERQKKYVEDREREQYERLQKKFGK